MKSAEIRSQFLEFFRARGHAVVASSPVVPHDDPTLLFANAGMNQFKDVFLGFDKRPYQRAVTSQKCVRAGGKHNDLENVGYTARHHTFFEMLGNFSFGDYFKRDALRFAWELLTTVFRLPPERLWVTVYAEDDEAHDIWSKDIGVPVERIIRIGDNKGARYASDNFWMMGDTGPCGPCSEIFYDHGPGIPGGPPGSPDEDGDRYIEIWNNVFMQYNRDEAGVLHPLPRPSVDTGMGLERISAVLQGVHSNYEIDVFVNLLAAARTAVLGSAPAGTVIPADIPSLRVLADHIRACAFIVADGVIPGNEGRGYVLRRIARRAVRHGYKLGARTPFFHRLVAALAVEMGDAYPELRTDQARITGVLQAEEERFFQTIAHGMSLLDEALAGLKPGGVLDGETAFRLHDTFGFPLDLTADVCRERDLSVDEAGFDAAMARQREQARAAGKFRGAGVLEYEGEATGFDGYTALEGGATVLALYRAGSPVAALAAGEEGVVVLDRTPFYAESGGQVGDQGVLDAEGLCFRVDDTRKIQSDVFGHHGTLITGALRTGDRLQARVDAVRRARTMRNHSATHLMHRALREVLGGHVQQKGSMVDAERTRFDFSHNAPLSAEEIVRIEAMVNDEVLRNQATAVRHMGYDDAVRGGAVALFGEKYGDEVRVLDIGSTRELCGGTHVNRTGDIGLFKIVAEGGIAAGVRRVEAVTGDNAVGWVQEQAGVLNTAAATARATPAELPGRIVQLQDQVRSLEKEIERLKIAAATGRSAALVAQAIDVGGTRVVVQRVDGLDAKSLRETVEQVKGRLPQGVVVLASVVEGKVQLVAGVGAERVRQMKAGELIGVLAPLVDGRGGGKPDLASAGGTAVHRIEEALAAVAPWVQGKGA